MNSQVEAGIQRKFPILFFLLFSLFVAVVYGVLFWWISMVMDLLVVDRARATARRLVDSYLLEYHLSRWETEPDKMELVRKMGEDLQMQSYHASFLTLDSPNGLNHPDVFPPESEQERNILNELRKELKNQSGEVSSKEFEPDAPEEAVQDYKELPALGDRENLVPVYRERYVTLAEDPGNGEYQYLQPVYWKKSCNICHRALMPGSAYTAAAEGDAFLDDHVFRVVKVSISDGEIRFSQTVIRGRLIVGGLAVYLVTLVGTLLLLIFLGGRRIRLLPVGGQQADYVPTVLVE